MLTLIRALAPLVLCCGFLSAQTISDNKVDLVTEEVIQGLKLRAIGPALMSGRIADIAVHPELRSTWYVAVGSGGVWKTTNAGITWKPLFEDQTVYSIGAVTLDLQNPDVVWVGTGENVSGRHVGWGDGVYKSVDGGSNWKRLGLETSEHIGKIVVDPRDGDVVYVAAEGPLWSSGGQRGLFKTTDGGHTWIESLLIDEDTGVTDVEIDPRNPDVLYAAAYQRRRHIWSLLSGGPGSGIFKSEDAGQSWRRLTQGLPKKDMGKIGLAVSGADPDVVYATIEADDEEKGFYRSLDRGETWSRRNEYISGGTGPHYYQEIVASPHDVDRVYQMDVFLHVTDDGGASFDILGNGREKHSDNHALVIDPGNADHLLVGTDAGLYESYDDGISWRHFPNLPISQFYKFSLDSATPFYNIVGGAQDLGTLVGPSRTKNLEGIRNQDWYVPLGADGYDTAVDPKEPNLMYMQTQNGNMYRYDRITHELIDIQPIPSPGEPPERFNWDAPILVSPHQNTRLYFGSQRLWRSNDRGDSWEAVSLDLTRNRNRYELEMMGRVWSVDALYDNGAMSRYGTITTISESRIVEGLIYVGTDDGHIQVTEDGGNSWRVAALPNVPEFSFVNDIQASFHHSDKVFVAIDAHKIGDFTPYLFESSDRGLTWHSVAGNLPEGEIVWSLEQDHVSPDLLFVGAEFGLYFSPDRGVNWVKLSGGVPTISFRDVEVSRREDDLVGASFGRGFYILDDYSSLREIQDGALEKNEVLFPVRDAWWYVPSVPMQARGKPTLGSDDFTAPNPPFGALITYYLGEARTTDKEKRLRKEQVLREKGENIPFPGWERLTDEAIEMKPKVFITVRDLEGRAVRRLVGPASPGIHRINWDLRLPPPDSIELSVSGFQPPWVSPKKGPFASPGSYQVEMAIVDSSGATSVGERQEFEVKAVPGMVLSEPDYRVVALFQSQTSDLVRFAEGVLVEVRGAQSRLRHMKEALIETPRVGTAIFFDIEKVEVLLEDLRGRLVGDRIRSGLNEATAPSILSRLGRISSNHWETRQEPTVTQRQSLEIAQRNLEVVKNELSSVLDVDIAYLEEELAKSGAPWTPGRKIR